MLKIHMLNVGNADCIIVELVDPFANELTLLVDGGQRNSAGDIIKYFHKINKQPDIVICTHLDGDHVGGLSGVVEEFNDNIDAIWVHRPEEHRKNLRTILENANNESSQLIYASIQDLSKFIDVSESYRIPILEPFSDRQDDSVKKICGQWKIKILGPTVELYESLVDKFKESKLNEVSEVFNATVDYICKAARDPCSVLGRKIDRPENESSIIFEIQYFAKKFLFTGDAGIQAFTDIKDKLEPVYWLKVPHHGSDINLNSELLTILSPARCFISADGHKHPDYELIECLKSKGINVSCTNKTGNLIETIA